MTALPDPAAVTRLLAEAAAVEIMPRFAKLAEGDVREKAPGDLVTVADVAAEHYLAPRLRALVTGSLIVGEEGVAADPALLARLGGEDPVWVVDPIDGTVNFASGKPCFAVMVALVRRGRALMSWIHDPVAGSTAVAVEGGGAFLDDRRLAVAKAPAENEGWTGNRRLARRLRQRPEVLDGFYDLRCAGHEYIMLAQGEAHFAFYNRLYPWDHAPGELLHREAGGFARLVSGAPYAPRGMESGLLLAPDPESWQRLREMLAV